MITVFVIGWETGIRNLNVMFSYFSVEGENRTILSILFMFGFVKSCDRIKPSSNTNLYEYYELRCILQWKRKTLFIPALQL